MTRTHWIAGALLACLTFAAGCSTADCGGGCGGSLWSRLCSRARIQTTASGPIVDGPILEDAGACANPAAPTFTAPPPLPTMPPAGQGNLPPLAPPPRVA